jgi:hypothetical protein
LVSVVDPPTNRKDLNRQERDVEIKGQSHFVQFNQRRNKRKENPDCKKKVVQTPVDFSLKLAASFDEPPEPFVGLQVLSVSDYFRDQSLCLLVQCEN